MHKKIKYKYKNCLNTNTSKPSSTTMNQKLHRSVTYPFHHERPGKSKHLLPCACDPAFIKNIVLRQYP